MNLVLGFWSMRLLLIFVLLCFLSLGYSAQGHQSKKIIALSIPKAGTTLLRKTIVLITEKPVTSLGGKRFDPHNHLKNKLIAESHHLQNKFNPVLGKHLRNKYIKIVLVRDPRDILVSWNRWISKGKDPHKKKEVWGHYSRKKRLSLLINSNFVLTEVKNAVNWAKDPSVLVVHFEELVGPKGGGNFTVQVLTVEKIAKHLGYRISRQRAMNISKKLFGGTSTFTGGEIHKWKHCFDKDLLEEFDAVYGKYFKLLGYDYEMDYLEKVKLEKSKVTREKRM